jgi:hydroxyethylthiazole kinase-like uncharacterized protein yjeF
MKLLSAQQIKEWDQFTIKNEPISSIDLMERASISFTHWFISKFKSTDVPVGIFCGNGNNGGDGLAIARLLRNVHFDVNIFITKLKETDSPDFSQNLERINKLEDVPVHYLDSTFPEITTKTIIVDALLGTGTQRKVTGHLAELIDFINNLPNTVVSVDLPSGLPADDIFLGPAIKSDLTFTFQLPKLSFFYQENEPYCPSWVVGDIGLHPLYYQDVDSFRYLIDIELVAKILKKRTKFSHKGSYGHAGLIAGSFGMMGAAVLCTWASIRSGVGLVTAMVPEAGISVIQNSVPEALILNVEEEIVEWAPKLDKFTGIGIGPGLGDEVETILAIEEILDQYKKPLVLDADALNILSKAKHLMGKIPKGSIITPHPKEFERWVGQCSNELDRFEKASHLATSLDIIVVLKGAHTRVFLPNGTQYINSTGNTGMATAGSGDVLTGILTGLLAQGYESHQSAIIGVFLHGLAGDLALQNQSEESLIARDIIDHLGQAFKKIKEHKSKH